MAEYRRYIYKPLSAPVYVVGGMQGEVTSTYGERSKQVEARGDAPAQGNRGAPAPSGGQAGLDKRAILAIIRAIARKHKLVLSFSDIKDELLETDGLLKAIRDPDKIRIVWLWFSLHDALREGEIKHVYPIHRDKVIASPQELSDEQIQILREIAELYDFGDYDIDIVRKVDDIIHDMIRMWNRECSGDSTLVSAMLNLARENGLSVNEVENTLPKDPYGGHITYSVEDTVFITIRYYPCECKGERGDCIDADFEIN